jgi:uncharacterized membrane protein
MTGTLQVIKNALLIAAIDLPYLLLVSGQFTPMIESIQGSPLRFRLWSAVPVYLALGYLFSLASSWRQAALIGAATYAVYDFTNYAAFSKYPLKFAIQDTLWGATLMAIAFKVGQFIF